MEAGEKRGDEQFGNDVQGTANGQQHFELVNGKLEVAFEAVAADLEQHLGVEEERHEQLTIVVVLKEVLATLAIVIEANGGRYDRVHQDADHDEHLKGGRLNELSQDQRCPKATVALIVVDLDQTPAVRIASQYLRNHFGCDGLSGAPHLLELYSNLVERFGDYGNENVFHQPGKKEDQRRIVGDLKKNSVS